jgi:hypothetical protein
MARALQGITGNKKNNANASDAERKKHIKLMDWFHQEMQRQAHNRYQMSLDENYYDSMQFTPQEEAEIKGRGQAPVVYNEIKPTIDWLIGTERRTRTDFNVINSQDDSPEADVDAKNKTKLLKYLAEANRIEFERSTAADDCFKAGLGWIEVGVNPDPEEEPIYVRSESWRNMLYDSLGPRKDLQDSRYLFRFRMVDLDIAIAFFPNKEQELRASCVSMQSEHYMEWFNNKPIGEQQDYVPMPDKYSMFDADAWTNNRRERVMLIEAWYKEPKGKSRPGAETSSLDRLKMQMQCTILTEKHTLLDMESPYKHNRYPFVPLWAYRRKRDNAPYGPIRPVRGPQDALNKRMSKALSIMSTNQVWAEAEAFDNKIMSAEEARDEARAPDGFILLAKGGMEKFKTHRENDVAEGHLKLAQVDQSMIRNSTGVSDENLNRTKTESSGIALQKKDEQGGKLTAELFDNVLFARQLEGELTVSLIEQYYSEPKVFSILGDRAKRDYVRINQTHPDTGEKLNDITARKAQFIIGEAAWRQSLAQAGFESMMQLLGELASIAPNVVQALLPIVFELGDFPNKKTIVQQIRQATNQPDPDEKQTPEQMQQQQQQKAIADKQVQSQMAQLDAEIKKAQASGSQLDAQALKLNMEALYVSMQAAGIILAQPQATTVADQLLASVGFTDVNGAPVAQAPAGMPPQLPPPGPPQGQPGQVTGEGTPPTAPNPMLADGAQAGIETPALNH